MESGTGNDNVPGGLLHRVGAPKKNVVINSSLVASLVTRLVNDCPKSQKQIAAESGFEKTNIITMVKSGRTKFPIRRTKDFANSVGCDPFTLLESILKEYMPEVMEIIEAKLREPALTKQIDQEDIPMRDIETRRTSVKQDDDRICTDFYFVHESGDMLYPIKVKNKDTGKIAFRVSEGGAGANTKVAGWEVDSWQDLKQYVLEMGCGTRCSTLNKTRNGLFSPNGRSITEVVRVR